MYNKLYAVHFILNFNTMRFHLIILDILFTDIHIKYRTCIITVKSIHFVNISKAIKNYS